MDEERPDDSDRSSRSGWSNKSRSRSCSPQERQVQSKLVYISNIPYEVTWTELKDVFHKNLGFSGFLKMAQDNNGKCTGLATMEFKSLGGAAKAIDKMNQFTIGERKIVVREPTPKDMERLSKYQSHSVHNNQQLLPLNPVSVVPSVNRLFPVITSQQLKDLDIEPPVTDSVYISNLNYSVNASQLMDLFKSAGNITIAIIKTDSNGNSRGTAAVSFSHPYEAVQAVAMFNNKPLKGREMRVRIDRQGKNPIHPPLYPPGPDPMSLPNPGIFAGPLESRAAALNDGLMDPKVNAAARALTNVLMAAQNGKDPTIHGPEGLADCLRLWTANSNEPPGSMNHAVSSDSLSQAFGILTQFLQPSQQRRPHSYQSGTGFVRPNLLPPSDNPPYSSKTDRIQQLLSAAMAGGMSETEVNMALRSVLSNKDSVVDGNVRNYGRPVDRISSDHGQLRARFRLDENSGFPFGGGYNNVPGANSTGFTNMGPPGNGMRPTVPPPGNSGYRPRRPDASIALVRNVPPSYEWHDVKRLFREVGEVLFCKMPLDSQGRTYGVAHVGFKEGSDCLRAIERFNGSMYEGCRLEVCPN